MMRRRNLQSLAQQFAKPGASNASARFIMSKLMKSDEGTLPIDVDVASGNAIYPRAAA